MVWWLWTPHLTSSWGDAQENLREVAPDKALSSLSRHGLQACCMFAPEEGFYHFSHNWSQVVGQMPGDCLGQGWHDFWHDYTRRMFDEALQSIFSDDPDRRIDSVVIEGDAMHGSGEWVTLELSLIASGSGAKRHLTLLVADVSAQKHMQAEVKKAQRETRAIEHCRSSFLSNMSHELRTPLNAILGFAQMLEAGSTRNEATAQEYLQHIRLSGEELLSKISDLIELANIDAGKLTIDESPINIKEAIEAAIEMNSHRAFEKSITIHQDIGRPHLVVRADRSRLLHCISHQLTEAISHSPEGAIVMIGCHADMQNGVSISLHDQGGGISKRRLQNIRNSLHHSGSYYHTDIDDVTIGLAVCKEILELHGGNFTIDSLAGRGTITTSHLPPERIVSLSARVRQKMQHSAG